MTTFVPTFPLFPSLSDAVSKARRLTGSTNSFQITDSQIISYMNSFYSYDLPSKFRSLKLKDFYTFTTNVGQATYPFNSELYTTVDQPCYVDKRETKFYTDPWQFYGVNFNWQQIDTFAVGDGTVGAFIGVITGITNATNAVVTSVGHGLTTGESVLINNVLGMTEVNGISFNITVIDANTFYLNVNSILYGVYSGGGNWFSSPYDGFTIASPLIPSVNNDPGPLTDTFTNPTLQGGTNLSFPMGRIQNLLISANTIDPSTGLGNTQNVTDDGFGNLIQIFQTNSLAGQQQTQQYGWTYYRQYASATPNTAGGAVINYQTGQISGLTFAQPIPAGTKITIAYNPKVFSIPLSILFYQNSFTLAPVPDQGYTVELTCYRQPIKALLAAAQTGNPELSEWWEILAVGAAKKIFEDRLDSDGVMYIDKMLKERYDIIETRTYAQLGQTRIYTIYTDQVTYNYANNGFGVGGFGGV